MGIEALGVSVENPAHSVSMDAGSYGELLAWMYAHGRNLHQAVALLNRINPDGSHEGLAELQNQLHLMATGVMEILNENLAIAIEDGVKFREVAPPSTIRN